MPLDEGVVRVHVGIGVGWVGDVDLWGVDGLLRPLLRGGDPLAILGKLLAEREPVYGTADITVKSDDGPKETVVKRIIAGLEDYAKRART